jgi:Rieske Fe-S protein
VVTVEGVALESVTIGLSGPESRTSNTDFRGAFSFEGLMRGVYTVTLSGFDPALHAFPATTETADTRSGKPVEILFSGTWVPQPPEQPTGLSALADGSNSVILAWADASDDETRFEVHRRVGLEDTWSQIGAPDPDAVAFIDVGLTPATTYGYRVRACNDAGCSSYTDEATATTDDVPPQAPTSLAAVATGPYAVDLSWTDASSNEARFEVERKGGGDAEWVPIATPQADAVAFSDSGLDSNTAYLYRVRACNEAGCSAYTDPAGATTDEVAPEAPSALSAAATGSTNVALSWIDGSDNEGWFEVERKEGTGGDWSRTGTPEAGATSYGDTGLTPNTTYAYRIRACNQVGCSTYSNEATAVTEAVPPATPLELDAEASGSTGVALSWTDASDNEALFRVERKRGSFGAWSEVATPDANATGYSDSGLTPNTTYLYRIRACNHVGCSAYSNQATATTDDVPPAAPSALTATATGSSTVHLTWTDRSNNETEFRVERKEGSGGSWSQIGTKGSNSTSYDDTGLSPLTGYFYRVRACNSVGCSAFSDDASATTPAASGPNLTIANLFLTQSTQTLGADVPLVAEKDGYLRVFAVASESNSLQPAVRVRFYLGGSLAHTEVIPAPGTAVPTSVNETTLAASWNVDVPASLIQPGLTILADVDPTDQVAEGDEGDNFFPLAGSPLVMDVRTTPTFNVTFVPVRQAGNSLLGNVTTGNAGQFMDVTLTMLPIAQANVLIHAEYLTTTTNLLESDNGNSAWSTILSEVYSLRLAEGASRYYYGVVGTTYSSGVAGMGYLGWRAAIGWDRLPSASGVAAHEWGHNFDRYHAPGCGAGNPDASYPYADGKIGVWGLDVEPAALKSPSSYYDFMSYCNPDWISDYSYEAILSYRQAHGGTASGSGPEASLLIWGRVSDEGIVLEPAFEVTTIPVLPGESGPYLLEAMDERGSPLFSRAFRPMPVPDAGAEEGHFAFAVPLRLLGGVDLARLRVSGGGSAPAIRESRRGPQIVSAPEPEFSAAGGSGVEMTWDAASFPMALVRDPSTGEILSFARGGRVSLMVSPPEIEVIFSDGLRNRGRVLRSVR